MITELAAIVSKQGFTAAENYLPESTIFSTKKTYRKNKRERDKFWHELFCLPILLLNFAFSMRYAYSNLIIALFFLSVCYIFSPTESAVICDVVHFFLIWVRSHFISHHCVWISIKIHFEWFRRWKKLFTRLCFSFFLSFEIVFSRFHILYTHSNASEWQIICDELEMAANHLVFD